jgi:hypothetical protein
MTNVNAAASDVLPQAGSDLAGWKIGKVDSVAKAAQNDTVTVVNAKALGSSVEVISITDDTSGASESFTVAENVITMTSATTGAKTAWIRFRPGI